MIGHMYLTAPNTDFPAQNKYGGRNRSDDGLANSAFKIDLTSF